MRLRAFGREDDKQRQSIENSLQYDVVGYFRRDTTVRCVMWRTRMIAAWSVIAQLFAAMRQRQIKSGIAIVASVMRGVGGGKLRKKQADDSARQKNVSEKKPYRPSLPHCSFLETCIARRNA